MPETLLNWFCYLMPCVNLCVKIAPKLQKLIKRKGPYEEPFRRANINGFIPWLGQDYPGITPIPKSTQLL
jgi:hypothetical protein